MIELVTPEEAKTHLRIEGTADDAWLDLIIPAVSQVIVNWCGGEDRVTDADGDPLRIAELAALVQIAYLDGNRGDMPVDKPSEWQGQGYALCATATALLSSLRQPTVQ